MTCVAKAPPSAGPIPRTSRGRRVALLPLAGGEQDAVFTLPGGASDAPRPGEWLTPGQRCAQQGGGRVQRAAQARDRTRLPARRGEAVPERDVDTLRCRQLRELRQGVPQHGLQKILAAANIAVADRSQHRQPRSRALRSDAALRFGEPAGDTWRGLHPNLVMGHSFAMSFIWRDPTCCKPLSSIARRRTLHARLSGARASCATAAGDCYPASLCDAADSA